MKNRIYFGISTALAVVLALAWGPAPAVARDCVECKHEDECGDWVYNPYDHCHIFQEGGEWYCNSVGECDQEQFALSDLTPAGTVLREGFTMDAEVGKLLTGCGSFIVTSVGDGSPGQLVAAVVM